MKTYGEIIRRARKKRELTMEQVAKEILSFKGYISGIESGKTPPPSAAITVKLCKFLNLNEEDMILLAHCEKTPKRVRGRLMTLLQQSRRMAELIG